jgi:hypothetical protein
MRRAQPEQIIQRAVLQHFAIRGTPGVFCTHFPAGGFRLAREAKRFKDLGTRSGVPDLLFIRAGHLYCLELKTESGRPSSTQLKTIAELEYAGATCAVAYGIDEALAVLEGWNLLRKSTASQMEMKNV